MHSNLGRLFIKTLHDQRGAILGYGLGTALYAGAMLAFYPSMRSFTGLSDLMESYPDALKAFFAGQEAWRDFASLNGFLSLEFFSLAPLIFAIFTCNSAAHLVSGEEEKGTLDLLLSNPLPRWRLVLEKYAALLVSLLLICLLAAAGVLVGAAAFAHEDKVSYGGLTAQCLNLLPLALLFGTMTFLATAFVRRRVAMGIGMGLTFAAYLWNGLSPAVKSLRPYQKISPFYLYQPMEVYRSGLDWGGVGLLLGLSLLFLLISLPLFQRKDLGV